MALREYFLTILDQGLASLFCQGQIVHILGFVGHTGFVTALLSSAVVPQKLSWTAGTQMHMLGSSDTILQNQMVGRIDPWAGV